MIYKENEEKYAVKIITDYLKEEKNIQIKKVRHLTKGEGQPPDCYFEIGDHKIGCEVRHFDLGKKGINLAEETGNNRQNSKKSTTRPTQKRNPATLLEDGL